MPSLLLCLALAGWNLGGWVAKNGSRMLYLTRKVGESIIINGSIEVTVMEVRGRSVRLGFTFPADATVLRREIYDRIQEENQAAAEGGRRVLEGRE